MFDLINIFDTFLPQLLLYPNPADPLNPEAAALMIKENERYEKKVKDHVQKYAMKNVIIIEKESPKSDKQLDKDGNSSSNEGQVIDDEDKIEDLDDFDEEDDDEKISLGDVSELSETSDIGLNE